MVGSGQLGRQEWEPSLGPPPYIEQALWPLYKAAVEAGDPGKLCPEGFLLFNEFGNALEKQRDAVWTAFSSLATVFAKASKPNSEVTKPWRERGNIGCMEVTWCRILQRSTLRVLRRP